MRTIEVDFNDLARGGKVRVWRGNTDGVFIGDPVTLTEEAEGMSERAVLSEVDGNWAYFEIGARPAPRTSTLRGIFMPSGLHGFSFPVVEHAEVESARTEGVSSRDMQDA